MNNVIKLREEFIKLGQALKASGLADSGVDAKILISEGNIKVNGQTELRRGRKLYGGDIIEYNGDTVSIED
jgi:ribosome-associated protein